MRKVAGLLAIALLCLPSIAQAHHYRHHYVHVAVHARSMVGGLGYGLAKMLRSSGELSADCQEARREGGPCGCHTAETLLGTSEHVWHGINLWLASDWADKFPHVSAAPGTAAVFFSCGGKRGCRAYHVAPVVAASGGSVTIADYYGQRTISAAGLVFVQPSGGYGSSYTETAPRHERRARYAQAETPQPLSGMRNY